MVKGKMLASDSLTEESIEHCPDIMEHDRMASLTEIIKLWSESRKVNQSQKTTTKSTKANHYSIRQAKKYNHITTRQEAATIRME